jgi:hypothetical protein
MQAPVDIVAVLADLLKHAPKAASDPLLQLSVFTRAFDLPASSRVLDGGDSKAPTGLGGPDDPSFMPALAKGMLRRLMQRRLVHALPGGNFEVHSAVLMAIRCARAQHLRRRCLAVSISAYALRTWQWC